MITFELLPGAHLSLRAFEWFFFVTLFFTQNMIENCSRAEVLRGVICMRKDHGQRINVHSDYK